MAIATMAPSPSPPSADEALLADAAGCRGQFCPLSSQSHSSACPLSWQELELGRHTHGW